MRNLDTFPCECIKSEEKSHYLSMLRFLATETFDLVLEAVVTAS